MVTKEWCIEKGFIPYEELLLEYPEHPLKGIPISKLGLKHLPLYDSQITVK